MLSQETNWVIVYCKANVFYFWMKKAGLRVNKTLGLGGEAGDFMRC